MDSDYQLFRETKVTTVRLRTGHSRLRHQFSSVQDGIYALGKAHMRSTPFVRCFPNDA